jgi:hypothetical protein
VRRTAFDPYFNGKNAKQINAPVAAEAFSLAEQPFEKYELRASNKPCDFNHIKNPYQIAVVQRSRQKPRRENTATLFAGSAVQSFAAKAPQNVVRGAAHRSMWGGRLSLLLMIVSLPELLERPPKSTLQKQRRQLA